MKTGLSYGDVCLIPKCSNVESRQNPLTSTDLTKSIKMSIPILAANMDTIIGHELAKVLEKNGSVPIFHRFYPFTSEGVAPLVKMVKDFPDSCFMSVGVGTTRVKEVMTLVEQEGLQPLGYCVDVAHGHSQAVLETVRMLKEWHPLEDVIAGNVCTKRAVHDLANAGADAIKVGIGPGSACTTRNVTAFGRAQFSAVQECAEVGQDLKVPIIADGGVRGSREIILALAAGASSVMIGGLFASTFEAAGKGKFRGQASAEFQRDFYGAVKPSTVPEGVELDVEVTQSAQDLIDELMGGLRSGMTYCAAIDIKELQRKAEFERVTPSYF